MTQSPALAACKKAARSQALARRDEISLDERARKSAAICSELLSIMEATRQRGGAASFTICVYAAMNSEVDVRPFAHAAWRAGARLAFPCMMRAENGAKRMAMRLVEVGQAAPFVESPLSTFPFASEGDPTEALAAFPVIEPQEIDLIVVPLVAFDSAGRRLGYGGGNYDAYLPLLRDDAEVVGVAFKEQRIERVPSETHDLALPRIISA